MAVFVKVRQDSQWLGDQTHLKQSQGPGRVSVTTTGGDSTMQFREPDLRDTHAHAICGGGGGGKLLVMHFRSNRVGRAKRHTRVVAVSLD